MQFNKHEQKLILAKYLKKPIINIINSELNIRILRECRNKHRNGSVIKRRNHKHESAFGTVQSEMIFWIDVSKMKYNIDLVDTSFIDDLPNSEVETIFNLHNNILNAKLDLGRQRIKVHKPVWSKTNES